MPALAVAMADVAWEEVCCWCACSGTDVRRQSAQLLRVPLARLILIQVHTQFAHAAILAPFLSSLANGCPILIHVTH